MDEKDKIDRIRSSGGMAEIGTIEDGAIVEMYTLGDRLLIIKEASIYEMFFADDVDPERTNAGLPNNIQKLVVKQGAKSELVGRIFLTAKVLFKPEFILAGIDVVKVVSLSLSLLQEAIALEKEISSYLEEEKRENDSYEEQKTQTHSYAIPVIDNLETRCKAVFQRTDHIDQILVEIASKFYPKGGFNANSRIRRPE